MAEELGLTLNTCTDYANTLYWCGWVERAWSTDYGGYVYLSIEE